MHIFSIFGSGYRVTYTRATCNTIKLKQNSTLVVCNQWAKNIPNDNFMSCVVVVAFRMLLYAVIWKEELKKKCKLTLVSFFVFCVLLFGAIFISCVSCYFLSLSSDFLGATIVCGDGGMQTTTNQNSCMRLHLNGMQQQVQVISQFFGRSFSFLHSFGACVLVKVLFFFFFCWVRKAERERKETKRRGC